MQGLIKYDYYKNQDFFIDFLADELKEKTYHIVTYGCQMNEHDSENMIGILNDIGLKNNDDINTSDIIIFNTCAIRENAEDRFFGNIGALKKLSEKNKDLIILVCGCMMQQEHIVNRILDKFRHINIIFGTHNIYKLPELLYQYVSSSKKNTIVDVLDVSGEVIEGLPSIRRYNFKGFVNIMYGCNNFCTYCIVPYTRGRERSRNPNDIVKEIKTMVNNGVKEITLLGQNVNSYGNTFKSDYSFSNLLKDINDIKGIKRIRFMTSHPKDIPDELIYQIRDLENVCESIHLPVQSGSTSILKKMNRHYTKEDYLKKIEKIKKNIPDIAITTDLIVGFPSETDEDFDETLSLVREVEYDSAFIFNYSERVGTRACTMENKVPEEVKKERFNELLDLTNSIANKKNKKFLNTIQDVLVEGISKHNNTTLTGRNRQNKLINFKGNKEDIGNIVDVRITSTNSFSLYGETI